MPFLLVTAAADQEVTATRSRQLRRSREFLAAVSFMVKGGYHPGANATTYALAQDFARRMHLSKDGHVVYGVAAMQDRLGLSRSTIMKHTRILRELGLLAFVEHGNARRNALRARLGERFGPGSGFRRTATLYAPCAPPLWDEAEGRLRAGTGYTSRIRAVTAAGRARAVKHARRSRAQQPAPRTPSCVVVSHDGPAPVSGGRSKDSGRPPAHQPGHRPERDSQSGHFDFTSGQAAAAIAYAQRVRPHIWWTQGGCLRQLAFALRPLIVSGFGWEEAVHELSRWSVPLRPTSLVGYVSSQIQRRARMGLLPLREGLVDPVRQLPVDERGERHAQMLRARQERFAPVFARYRQVHASSLRAALRRARTPPSTPASVWTPWLREPESSFYAAQRPDYTHTSVLEIYRRQAKRLPPPSAPRPPAGPSAALLAELADHAAAVAACARLRAQLTAWEKSARIAPEPYSQAGGEQGSGR
ncbi:hypothetical protein [Streptomyces sp. NPDC059994]|uniref:hypothetical protein n=1 Tax=Streptomyces sp. NPDC059994 TaxID=3347029 RepID=UPI00367D209A